MDVNTALTLALAAGGGFLVRTIATKVNLKQQMVASKIAVYGSIFGQWVKARNFVYAHLAADGDSWREFDAIYGESQALIGRALLLTEGTELTDRINALTERLYRQPWHELSTEQKNEIMESVKTEGMDIARDMRRDIEASTRLSPRDVWHMLTGWGAGQVERRPAMPEDSRHKAHLEAKKDKEKSYDELLTDIHEELLHPSRTPEDNIRHALKRICSLLAKTGSDAARAQRTMVVLTCVVAALAGGTLVVGVGQLTRLWLH